jgi:hypothetical protein
MSEVYCMSYSDWGYLLTDKAWDIKIRKLEDCDYGVYEDVLSRDGITIYRRFLANLPSVFDDTDEKTPEPTLPSEISRFIMSYKDKEVVVIGSYDFNKIFSTFPKNEHGFVLTKVDNIVCPLCNEEDLAEDLVLLASNGVDLNQA